MRRAGPGSEGSAGIGTKEERWSRVRRGVLVQGPKRSAGFYFVNMNDG